MRVLIAAVGIVAVGIVGVEIVVDGIVVVVGGIRLRVRPQADVSRADGIRDWIRYASGLLLVGLGRVLPMMSLWI